MSIYKHNLRRTSPKPNTLKMSLRIVVFGLVSLVSLLACSEEDSSPSGSSQASSNQGGAGSGGGSAGSSGKATAGGTGIGGAVQGGSGDPCRLASDCPEYVCQCGPGASLPGYSSFQGCATSENWRCHGRERCASFCGGEENLLSFEEARVFFFDDPVCKEFCSKFDSPCQGEGALDPCHRHNRCAARGASCLEEQKMYLKCLIEKATFDCASNGWFIKDDCPLPSTSCFAQF